MPAIGVQIFCGLYCSKQWIKQKKSSLGRPNPASLHSFESIYSDKSNSLHSCKTSKTPNVYVLHLTLASFSCSERKRIFFGIHIEKSGNMYKIIQKYHLVYENLCLFYSQSAEKYANLFMKRKYFGWSTSIYWRDLLEKKNKHCLNVCHLWFNKWPVTLPGVTYP